MKPLSHVTDPRMVKALAHPLRIQILDALQSRTASPRELAAELGAPLGNVSYHVRRLQALGVLKLVEEAPRRGVVEHFYRAETRPGIQGEAWEHTPAVMKEAFLETMLARIAAQVNAAAAAGGFDRGGSHVGRLPLALDEEGFAEAAAAVEELSDRLSAIEGRSRARMERDNKDEGVPSAAVLMLFEARED